MFIIYDIVFIFFAVFYLPIFLFKLKNANSRGCLIKHRFGFVSALIKESDPEKKRIWVHAVSVGEVKASEVFVNQFLKQPEEYEVFFSTVTPTGNALASKVFGDKVKLFYLPFDLSFISRHVMHVLAPSLLVVLETELWPNLFRAAKKMDIPIGVVNGRFSPRSFRRYYRFRKLFSKTFEALDFIFVQNAHYRRKYRLLGVSSEKVIVTGNMKYDLMSIATDSSFDKEKWLVENNFSKSAKIIVAASTHEKEEEKVCQAFRVLQEKHECILIMAPRHPERDVKVLETLKQYHLSFQLAKPINEELSKTQVDVYVLNTIGELASLLSIADVVFVGGSLVSVGGHNPLEAAVWKKPILSGPHVFNFPDIYKSLRSKNAVDIVNNVRELEERLDYYLSNPDEALIKGTLAYESMMKMQGASIRNFQLVRTLLHKSNRR